MQMLWQSKTYPEMKRFSHVLKSVWSQLCLLLVPSPASCSDQERDTEFHPGKISTTADI